MSLKLSTNNNFLFDPNQYDFEIKRVTTTVRTELRKIQNTFLLAPENNRESTNQIVVEIEELIEETASELEDYLKENYGKIIYFYDDSLFYKYIGFVTDFGYREQKGDCRSFFFDFFSKDKIRV